mmetsp:Transcript_39545/g.93076  ORF Transcript_39545/g.93076 Transcript_39545/m.93076 type:complete len:211 (+) Transcript_39545:2790-3422(+)
MPSSLAHGKCSGGSSQRINEWSATAVTAYRLAWDCSRWRWPSWRCCSVAITPWESTESESSMAWRSCAHLHLLFENLRGVQSPLTTGKRGASGSKSLRSSRLGLKMSPSGMEMRMAWSLKTLKRWHPSSECTRTSAHNGHFQLISQAWRYWKRSCSQRLTGTPSPLAGQELMRGALSACFWRPLRAPKVGLAVALMLSLRIRSENGLTQL